MSNRHCQRTKMLFPAIITAVLVLAGALSVALALNKASNTPLIEMNIAYVENPAYFFKDMFLVWDETQYHVTNIQNPKPGREIGIAHDIYSTWRVFELRGYNRDYLYIVESEDVWRVMSIYPPEQPVKQYIMENVTDADRGRYMLSVSLYGDNRAGIAQSPLSSTLVFGNLYYRFDDSHLYIYQEEQYTLLTFDVVSDDVIILTETTLYMTPPVGTRYITQAYTP